MKPSAGVFRTILFSTVAWAAVTSALGASYWTNSSGGLFSAATNWAPNVVPGLADAVWFTNAAGYRVTVDSAATNALAFFTQGSVTQAIGSDPWYVLNEWRVGEAAGATSHVYAASGLLAVTNGSGTGVLSVGRNGTGELAISGGDVVTDTLWATNGNNSLLTLSYGSLTTLHGATVSNGTLVVGLVTNAPFVWNIRGGTNSLLNNGSYGYGGLTLGTFNGAGRATVDIAGSNVSLSVPGLDVYGTNSLSIRQGATFHTTSVQLGLQTGSGNVVVIADPGSAWTNDYLMYFGMHAGGQTMLLTNGGYFQTGGTTYSDQRFTAFEQPGNTILVSGSNSCFNSIGGVDLGESWSSPVSPLNNLLLVTNGGRFWAHQVTYGSTNLQLGSVSRPGNVIDIADGSLWIGSLTFAVGTLQLEAGSGSIDQMSLVGGTNAILGVQNNLYVGHHGALGPGELRVGAGTSIIPSWSGELHSGGWQLGVFAGDIGNVTMTGGRAFVTNASGTAPLLVGGAGSGSLYVNSGPVQADLVSVGNTAGGSGLLVLNGPGSSLATPSLTVGMAGTVVVSNAATLQFNSCSAPAASIALKDATLGFTSGNPSLPSNALLTTNATISYRGASAAQVDLADPAYLGRLQRSGRTTLQLIQSTNSAVAALVFRDNDLSSWSKLMFNGGACALQAGSILIDANSSLAATNTTATISGAFTNGGQILLNNSVLQFAGPVTLADTASLQGAQGTLLFTGGLHLPAGDIIVPAGITVQASSIASDGGRLVINGGGFIPAADGTVPTNLVVFQDGWVTYLDNPAAPVLPPAGVSGSIGLELIRSTNAGVLSQTFTSGAGGYQRLRLGAGSHWQSQDLRLSAGASMYLADPSASVNLTSGWFRVEQGALFRDDTGGTNFVGFSSASSNATVSVSGLNSTWLAPNTLSLGATGSNNQMLVDAGGQLLAGLISLGGSASASGNSLRVNGANCFATNGLTLAGQSNQFLLQTGAIFKAAQIIASGTRPLVSLVGAGVTANCSNQVVLSGNQALLQLANGATLLSSNGLLNALFGGSLADISGPGTRWQLTGALNLSASIFTTTNHLAVSSNASVITPSLSLASSSAGAAVVSIQSGQVWVTNAAGTAPLTANGRLELSRGYLRADKLTATSSRYASINLWAGKAEWAACDLAAGIPLAMGDGTNLATLNLLGGTNLCRSGLEVRRYAKLGGSGTIVGAVTNRGWLWPATLTIQSNLVLDTSSDLTFLIAGAPGSSLNSSLSVTGAVSLAGTLGIALAPGTLISNSQVFVLLQCGSLASNFSNVAFGQRLLTADGLASFRIDNTGTAIIATDFQAENPGGTAQSPAALQLELLAQQGVNLHFPYWPSHSYSMQVSVDLVHWTEYPIDDISFDANGLATWSDPGTAGATQRFYRLLIR